jgi:hypothetical protein
MVIRSRGPSKDYDAGWEAVFGKRELEELTELSQEMGLYEDQDKQPTGLASIRAAHAGRGAACLCVICADSIIGTET